MGKTCDTHAVDKPGSLSEKGVFIEEVSGLMICGPGGNAKLCECKDSCSAVWPGNKTKTSKRPPFEVRLVRTGEHWRTLGLLVSPGDNPKYLVIGDIWEPSLISEWNRSHNDTLQVKPGDKIVAVDDCMLDAVGMLAKIQASTKGMTL